MIVTSNIIRDGRLWKRQGPKWARKAGERQGGTFIPSLENPLFGTKYAASRKSPDTSVLSDGVNE